MDSNTKYERKPKINFQLETEEKALLQIEDFRRHINIKSLTDAARSLIAKGYESFLKEQEILQQG